MEEPLSGWKVAWIWEGGEGERAMPQSTFFQEVFRLTVSSKGNKRTNNITNSCATHQKSAVNIHKSWHFDEKRKARTCFSPRDWITAESARAIAGEAKNSPIMTSKSTRKNTWKSESICYFSFWGKFFHLFHSGAFKDLVAERGAHPLRSLVVVHLHIVEDHHWWTCSNLNIQQENHVWYFLGFRCNWQHQTLQNCQWKEKVTAFSLMFD